MSVEDLDAVEALLEKKAHRAFEQFAKMARQHPAGELLPALLLPLSRIAEPEPDDAPTAGESETDAGVGPQALAVVGEVEPPPMEIPIADFGGFAIDPPIVVGAEPWAGRPTGEPSGEPDTSQATVVDDGAGVLSASTTVGGGPDDAVPEPPRAVPVLVSGAGGESEELAR